MFNIFLFLQYYTAYISNAKVFSSPGKHLAFALIINPGSPHLYVIQTIGLKNFEMAIMNI